ncbi:hypothetical protein ACWOOC_14920 [Citrobacter sp. ESY80]
MFKLSTAEGFDYDYDYYPVTTSLRSIYASLNQRMMVLSKKQEVKTFSLESCHLFDLDGLEEAFDCEFVTLPEDIDSVQDFRKWIMEMKFE